MLGVSHNEEESKKRLDGKLSAPNFDSTGFLFLVFSDLEIDWSTEKFSENWEGGIGQFFERVELGAAVPS